MSDIDWGSAWCGALCFGIPGLLIVRALWRRAAWARLGRRLDLEPAPRARTPKMSVIPLRGRWQGRDVQLWIEPGTSERSATMVAVEFQSPLQLGLFASAVTWQQSADNMMATYKRFTSPIGIIKAAIEHVHATPEAARRFFADDAKLNKKYDFRAAQPEHAKRLIDQVAPALLRARKPRWSVLVYDHSVILTPGIGTITSHRKIKEALGVAVQLACELEQAAGTHRPATRLARSSPANWSKRQALTGQQRG